MNSAKDLKKILYQLYDRQQENGLIQVVVKLLSIQVQTQTEQMERNPKPFAKVLNRAKITF